MKDALMEMVKDRVDAKVNEKEQKTKTLDIKNLMTNLKLTVEQVMDALGIPQAQRGMYAGLVQKKL